MAILDGISLDSIGKRIRSVRISDRAPPRASSSTLRWTPERVTKLNELRLEGRTARQIANTLGGISRNAVIGKCRRLGWPLLSEHRGGAGAHIRKPHVYTRGPYKPRGEPKAVKTAPPILPAQPLPSVPPPPPPLGLTVLELHDATEERAGTCKWSDSEGSPYRFCGQPTAFLKSYCEYHDRLAHIPESQRKRRSGTAYWLKGAARR